MAAFTQQMIDRRRFDLTRTGGGSQEQQGHAVGAAGHREADALRRIDQSVEIGAKTFNQDRLDVQPTLRHCERSEAIQLDAASLRSSQ